LKSNPDETPRKVQNLPLGTLKKPEFVVLLSMGVSFNVWTLLLVSATCS